MQYYVAGAGEVLLAEQKDEEHIEELRKKISSVVKDLFGSNFWVQWYYYIAPVTKILYYCFTTLSGVQTLGEEDNSLIVVTKTGVPEIPTFWQRSFFLALYVLFPLFKKIGSILFRYFHSFFPATVLLRIRNILYSEVYISAIHFLRFSALPLLSKFHRAFFYLFGDQYLIEKSIVGFHYISIRAQANTQGRKLFRALGFLTLYQTGQTVLIWLLKFILDWSKQPVPSRNKFHRVGNFCCPICLENKPPACTPCGHLFCWHCILEHSISSIVIDKSSSKCPQCRLPFAPSRVVPLLNF